MPELHLVQTGFFKPILDSLGDTSANVEKLLQHSGLNKFRLDNRDNYVPAHSMYALFDTICRQEGINDLVENFVEVLQFVNMSQITEMIAYTPDLMRACQNAVKHDQIIFTHEKIELEINGHQSKLTSRFIDNPEPGREQADHLNLAFILNGFCLAGGKNWAPLEIHLQTSTAPNFDVFLPEGNYTKIFLDQPATAIVFPTVMLTLPMLGKDIQTQLPSNFPEKPSSLSHKIELLLTANHMEVMPSLEIVSDMANMSSRTLQRKLTAEDTTFFEILDQWRFKSALKMLAEPNKKIKEISAELRYANVPNFERAFRRWTQTTPQKFRDASSAL